jgi:Uma2 family endonuclease
MATAQRFIVSDTEPKFTSADLLLLADDNKRYEIIEGELFVSRSPTFDHQFACTALGHYLFGWNLESQLGVVVTTPGLVFADDDDVAPDLVWISHERLEDALDESRHFRVAPELVVEVLSPGKTNEERDRKAKLKLYSRRGVQEYWIVDWITQQVEVYRRAHRRLRLVETLLPRDKITSPLLPGFNCQVSSLFFIPPRHKRSLS